MYVSKSSNSHAFIFMPKNVLHETFLVVAREACTHRRQLAWRMFKFCSGDFPHLSFPLRRFVCLPFLFVSPPSSLASCCYCSLMRPQSGQNYGGCGKVEEKSNEQLLDHKIFLFFVETASSLQKISRVGYHAGISAKMPTMYLPKSKRFSAPQNSVAK